MAIIIDTPARISRLVASLKSVAIGNGLTRVNPGYMLDVNGERALDVEGNPVALISPTFKLDVSSEYVLDVNGKKILEIGSEPYSLGRVTPLNSTAYECQWVTVQALPDNYRNVWVGGPGVRYGGRNPVGNWLSPSGNSVTFPNIDDLSKVFIHGYVTDGVTWSFGVNESMYLGGTDGFGLGGTDYTPLGGTT